MLGEFSGCRSSTFRLCLKRPLPAAAIAENESSVMPLRARAESFGDLAMAKHNTSRPGTLVPENPLASARDDALRRLHPPIERQGQWVPAMDVGTTALVWQGRASPALADTERLRVSNDV
jgi:hypothetical protein